MLNFANIYGRYGFTMTSLLLSVLNLLLRLTHPTALLDPVAEPPVTEAYAACGEEKQQDVYNESQWSSSSLDVSSVDGPRDRSMALFLSLHQLVCWIVYQNIWRKENGSMTHHFLAWKVSLSMPHCCQIPQLSPPLALSAGSFAAILMTEVHRAESFSSPPSMFFKFFLTRFWKREWRYELQIMPARTMNVRSLNIIVRRSYMVGTTLKDQCSHKI